MSDYVALLVTLECNYQPHLDFQRWLPCVGYVPARFMLVSLFLARLGHDLDARLDGERVEEDLGDLRRQVYAPV